MTANLQLTLKIKYFCCGWTIFFLMITVLGYTGYIEKKWGMCPLGPGHILHVCYKGTLLKNCRWLIEVMLPKFVLDQI